jgi:hypothetical protein
MWPKIGSGSHFAQGTVATSSAVSPIVLTTGTSAHAKRSSYTEIIAATSFRGRGLLVQFGGVALDANINYFVDIGIGAGGAEVVLIPDIFVSTGGNGRVCYFYYFPVNVPKGSRLSARCSGSTASLTQLPLALQVYGGPGGYSGPVKMYGGTVASSSAVNWTTLPSSQTAWLEIASVTEHRHSEIILGLGKLYTDTAITDDTIAIDIGIGGSGAETELIKDVIVGANGGVDGFLPSVVGPLPIEVPKGSRLTARIRGGVSQPSEALVLYGVG